MRAVRWTIFATLAASVAFLVSVAAQSADEPRTAPARVTAGEQGATREFSVNGARYAYQPPEIRVNRDDLVKITFTAADMPHSFTIDEYRISKRAGAGQSVTFEFRADRAGTFTYYCNLSTDERCKDMKGHLIVQ